MKTALSTLVAAFFAISAQAQTHKMWVNTQTASLREHPAATSHTMLKLRAPAQLVVSDAPKEYAQNPALKGKWVQATFAPYNDGGVAWVGWVEARYLVASRDSVKVPPAAELFQVPDDEAVAPKRMTVKGVAPAARNYNGRVRVK